jgi:hypothetical protein
MKPIRAGPLYSLLILSSMVLAACREEAASDRPEAGDPQSQTPNQTAVTTADTGAMLNPPASLSMDDQHHTMREIVLGYAEVNRELAEGEAAEAAAAARAVAELADRIPAFVLHMESMDREDLTRYARQFKGEMLRVAELAARDSIEAASSLNRRVTQTCQVCHDKYMATPAQASEVEAEGTEHEPDEHGESAQEHQGRDER